MVERDPSQLPRHVAVIMDGNGRWAQQRGLPRLHGHRAGKESVRAVVETSRELVRHFEVARPDPPVKPVICLIGLGNNLVESLELGNA